MSVQLSVHGLSRHFGGIRAVDEVSFSTVPGQITGVIGPNGAGKTTLFNLIAGATKPSAGVSPWTASPLRVTRWSLWRARVWYIRFR